MSRLPLVGLDEDLSKKSEALPPDLCMRAADCTPVTQMTAKQRDKALLISGEYISFLTADGMLLILSRLGLSGLLRA